MWPRSGMNVASFTSATVSAVQAWCRVCMLADTMSSGTCCYWRVNMDLESKWAHTMCRACFVLPVGICNWCIDWVAHPFAAEHCFVTCFEDLLTRSPEYIWTYLAGRSVPLQVCQTYLYFLKLHCICGASARIQEQVALRLTARRDRLVQSRSN